MLPTVAVRTVRLVSEADGLKAVFAEENEAAAEQEQQLSASGRGKRKMEPQMVLSVMMCPVGCVVRVPRTQSVHGADSTWCTVRAHTTDGKLVVVIPDPGRGERKEAWAC